MPSDEVIVSMIVDLVRLRESGYGTKDFDWEYDGESITSELRKAIQEGIDGNTERGLQIQAAITKLKEAG